MDETDSLVSHALNNMSVNELAFAYATLKIQIRPLDKYRNALESIAMYGTSRPLELGEGDDGDGHFRRIALNCIAIAAKTLGGKE